MNTRLWPSDVVRLQTPKSIRDQRKCAFPRKHPDQVVAAICELFIQRSFHRHVAHHVGPIDTVHLSLFQASAGEKLHQLVGEYDVDIGCQNELTSRTPDSHVLGNHLVEGQRRCVTVLGMHFRRHFDNPHLARPRLGRPTQRRDQPFAFRGRVPLHYNQFRRQIVPLGLIDPGIHEYLHTPKQVTTVVVIPRRDDYRQIRCIGILLTRTSLTQLHET